LDRSVFSEVMALTGDIGCRANFGNHLEGIVKQPVEDIGILLDLDSKDDFERMREFRTGSVSEKVLMETVNLGGREILGATDSGAKAEALRRPMKYLASAGESKEEVARGIAAREKIEEGLVCVLSCVEPCQTFEVYRNRETRKLELVSRIRKCLFFYHYWNTSRVWILKCAATNVVSVLDTGVYERAGVAGAADGASGDEVRAAG
jgi:hypothetical protein